MKLATYIAAALVLTSTAACAGVTYEDAKAESRKAGQMIEELTWNKNGLQIPMEERKELESWWMRSAYNVNKACDPKDFACVKKYYKELQSEMVVYRKRAVQKYGLRPKKEYQSPEKISF